MSLLGIVVFGLFGNSELAPWAEEHNLELKVALNGEIVVADQPLKS